MIGPDDMQMLFIGFEDGVSLPKAKREIIKLLRERYRVRGKDINPFTIRTTKEFMEESAQVRGIFQIVLVAIASISLLVEAAVTAGELLLQLGDWISNRKVITFIEGQFLALCAMSNLIQQSLISQRHQTYRSRQQKRGRKFPSSPS